jgi:hypothetical protein
LLLLRPAAAAASWPGGGFLLEVWLELLLLLLLLLLRLLRLLSPL